MCIKWLIKGQERNVNFVSHKKSITHKDESTHKLGTATSKDAVSIDPSGIKKNRAGL